MPEQICTQIGFIIISNKTGPVTLTSVLSYQENIKHKSELNLQCFKQTEST